MRCASVSGATRPAADVGQHASPGPSGGKPADAVSRYIHSIGPVNMESTTYHVDAYRPDHGFSPIGLIVSLPVMAAAAIAVGGLLGWVSQFFYLILIFPLVAGAMLGGGGTLAVRVGKLRNILLATLLGVVAAVGAMGTMHLMDRQRAIDELRTHATGDTDPDDRHSAELGLKFIESMSLLEYLDWYAEAVGVSISSRGSKGANLGHTGTWIYWAVEFAAVGLIVVFMMGSAAREPFDADANAWKEEHVLLKGVADSGRLEQSLAAGDLAGVAAALNGRDRVTVIGFWAANPSPDATIDLRLKVTTKDSKGNDSESTTGTWSYPAGAREALSRALKRQPVDAANPGAVDATSDGPTA